MTYHYEGDAYIKEVKRRLAWYGPDPSEEVIVLIMHELYDELSSTEVTTYCMKAISMHPALTWEM
ncbi:Hypothetical predicted protein [Pelobates cultripes]|uniref:Uncharacterized protein n=1 Tax=Pelobates cultripes TaxID=61616 RepID=A0AAD1R6A9_PELCU|nr:Hypothetical predicted protein [Pelobates cultripes]